MTELAIGQPPPAFTLPASTGGEISLVDYQGQQVVVLYFYPRDLTPGCTREACSFRDLKEEFAAAGAVILGVSTDSLASHDRFRERHELNFPLLADTEATVAQAYGVWQAKNNYGKVNLGIVRTTFVIDKAGLIRKIYPKVKVDQHADAVLEFVKTLA